MQTPTPALPYVLRYCHGRTTPAAATGATPVGEYTLAPPVRRTATRVLATTEAMRQAIVTARVTAAMRHSGLWEV